MANEKIINSRIRLRYDLYSAWSTNNPVLLAGEVALAYIPADTTLNDGVSVTGTTPPQVLMKVGDGKSHYNDLKYVSALAADVLNVCKDADALEQFVANVIADSGIASDEAMEALAGRVDALEKDHVTKQNLADVNAKFASYKTAEEQKAIDDEQDRRLGVIEGDYLKAEDIADFETKENVQKVADALAEYITANDAALAAEVKAREEADEAFETRISTIEGKFSDGEGSVASQIATAVAAEKAEREAADALKADKSVVEAMYTNGQIDTAVQGAKDYAKGLVDALPEQTNYSVSIEEDTTDSTIAKRYIFKQLGEEIGRIDLAKELVVTAGSVKEVTEADKPYSGAVVGDKYIELVIANQDAPIYVPAKDLVDIYTAKEGAAEVQVAISNTNEISATLVNGGVTEAKLDVSVAAKLNKTWEEVGVAKGLVDALAEGQVKTNKEAIEAINDAETGILALAKADAANLYETKNTAQTLIDSLKLAETYEAKGEAAKAQAAAEAKVTELANGQVATNALAIEANAQAIAANKTAIEAIYKVDGENKSGVLVTEIARVEGKADANALAIAAINNEETGILALAKAHTAQEISKINLGITSVVSGHEAITVDVVDGEATIGFAENIVINAGDSTVSAE